MKLQDQVCTLEQAKRLKELGVTDDSTPFVWKQSAAVVHLQPDNTYKTIQEAYGIEVWYRNDVDRITEEILAPAFTVAELGAMLPDGADCHGKHWAQFNTFRVAFHALIKKGKWHCYCHNSNPSGFDQHGNETYEIAKSVHGETEAEARAAMLIHLLENNLTTPSSCNNRLTQE